MTTRPLLLKLELQLDRDPIAGRLSDAQGQTTAFTGWLELIALVEKALVQVSERASNENETA